MISKYIEAFMQYSIGMTNMAEQIISKEPQNNSDSDILKRSRDVLEQFISTIEEFNVIFREVGDFLRDAIRLSEYTLTVNTIDAQIIQLEKAVSLLKKRENTIPLRPEVINKIQENILLPRQTNIAKFEEARNNIGGAIQLTLASDLIQTVVKNTFPNSLKPLTQPTQNNIYNISQHINNKVITAPPKNLSKDESKNTKPFNAISQHISQLMTALSKKPSKDERKNTKPFNPRSEKNYIDFIDTTQQLIDLLQNSGNFNVDDELQKQFTEISKSLKNSIIRLISDNTATKLVKTNLSFIRQIQDSNKPKNPKVEIAKVSDTLIVLTHLDSLEKTLKKNSNKLLKSKTPEQYHIDFQSTIEDLFTKLTQIDPKTIEDPIDRTFFERQIPILVKSIKSLLLSNTQYLSKDICEDYIQTNRLLIGSIVTKSPPEQIPIHQDHVNLTNEVVATSNRSDSNHKQHGELEWNVLVNQIKYCKKHSARSKSSVLKNSSIRNSSAEEVKIGSDLNDSTKTKSLKVKNYAKKTSKLPRELEEITANASPNFLNSSHEKIEIKIPSSAEPSIQIQSSNAEPSIQTQSSKNVLHPHLSVQNAVSSGQHQSKFKLPSNKFGRAGALLQFQKSAYLKNGVLYDKTIPGIE